jgi:thymidine kinase
MAKLYFRYGAVGSAKTLNLLAVAHSYRQQGKKVMVGKPRLDQRFGLETVKSRAGLECPADLLLDDTTQLSVQELKGYDCFLVDEAQFLSSELVDQLRGVSIEGNLPVICYGLRTDFRTYLFPGSRRLMEVADEISEVKTTCFRCNKKGIFNLKIIDGKPTNLGPTIELGADEKYQPVCARCYSHSFGGLWTGGLPEENS